METTRIWKTWIHVCQIHSFLWSTKDECHRFSRTLLRQYTKPYSLSGRIPITSWNIIRRRPYSCVQCVMGISAPIKMFRNPEAPKWHRIIELGSHVYIIVLLLLCGKWKSMTSEWLIEWIIDWSIEKWTDGRTMTGWLDLLIENEAKEWRVKVN